ncbi:hypothetical protein PS15p_201186 [Mucor circinelloides]
MSFFSLLLFIYQEVGIDKQDIQILLAVDISNDEKTYSDLVVDSNSSTVDDPPSLKPFEISKQVGSLQLDENEIGLSSSSVSVAEEQEEHDGGYGWFVVVGGFLVQVTTFGTNTSWGNTLAT